MKRRRTCGMEPAESLLVERSKAPSGVELVNHYRVGKHSSGDIVELAREIQQADRTVHATACGKLQVIAEQMRFLQAQAQRVLLDARADQERHHAHCNFKRVPGHTYHLYRRSSGETYWSMLSPQEWGTGAPLQEHMGAYRLEHDMSWTPASKMEERTLELSQFNNLLAGNQRALTCTMDINGVMDTASP